MTFELQYQQLEIKDDKRNYIGCYPAALLESLFAFATITVTKSRVILAHVMLAREKIRENFDALHGRDHTFLARTFDLFKLPLV